MQLLFVLLGFALFGAYIIVMAYWVGVDGFAKLLLPTLLMIATSFCWSVAQDIKQNSSAQHFDVIITPPANYNSPELQDSEPIDWEGGELDLSEVSFAPAATGGTRYDDISRITSDPELGVLLHVEQSWVEAYVIPWKDVGTIKLVPVE